MRFYIADCHFYHKRLLSELDCRPFSSVEEMNETMIKKWNARVSPTDEVVILGDFSVGNGEETNRVAERLHGRLYLIIGNHDRRFLKDKQFNSDRFEWIQDYAEMKDNKRKVLLMHYPVFCYKGQFNRDAQGKPNTFMLHGHIHNSEDQVLVDRFIDMTRSTYRTSLETGQREPVACQIYNCFCMYSDYTPLTLDEWIKCDRQRRERQKRQVVDFEASLRKSLEMFSEDYFADGRGQC